MTIRYILTAFILLAGFSSCKKNSVRGEGQIVTETRTLSGFDAINMNGSTRLHVQYGPAFSVEVKGYGNLVPLLNTEVKSGKLYVTFKGVFNVHNDNTEVFVTMPALKSIVLNGSGDADVTGTFPHAPYLYFKISGSAELSMGAGSADELGVEISGSGNMDLYQIVAKDAEIEISGSGKVKINATRNLEASISGSGSVYYKGNPQVSSHVSGSGRVIKEN